MLITKNKLVKNASKILEEELNIKLPEDYKKFLDKYNGGTTPKTYVKIGRSKDDVRAFFGYDVSSSTYDFSRLEKTGTLGELLEKKLFPIASNSGGDFYVISLHNENYGEILIYYHDLLGKKKVIASNFSEFINNCSSEPIGHIPTIEEREATAIANGYVDEVEDLRPLWQKEIEKFSNLVQEEVILD